MRVFGVTYDTGFVSADTTTHEPFDDEIVRLDMRAIRETLHCDAVRITGGVADRLETAATIAADLGLGVWYSPFTNGSSRPELAAFLLDAADRAERLRVAGAAVVLVAGSEISLFTDGFLPGSDLDERIAVLTDPVRVQAALPRTREEVGTFFAEILPRLRERFGGPITYASLPHEGIDWTPFDLVASDAGYPDATTADTFRESVRRANSGPKPFAATEFGCVTYTGAADRGGRGEDVILRDDDGRAIGLAEDVVRDEDEQARYVLDVLRVHEQEGTDAAFVNTFARRDLPIGADLDADVASFGVVAVLPPGERIDGRPWRPKAAFHALAEYGRRRRAARTGAVDPIGDEPPGPGGASQALRWRREFTRGVHAGVSGRPVDPTDPKIRPRHEIAADRRARNPQ